MVTVPATPTTDQNISDAALSPPDYSMQGPDLLVIRSSSSHICCRFSRR